MSILEQLRDFSVLAREAIDRSILIKVPFGAHAALLKNGGVGWSPEEQPPEELIGHDEDGDSMKMDGLLGMPPFSRMVLVGNDPHPLGVVIVEAATAEQPLWGSIGADLLGPLDTDDEDRTIPLLWQSIFAQHRARYRITPVALMPYKNRLRPFCWPQQFSYALMDNGHLTADGDVIAHREALKTPDLSFIEPCYNRFVRRASRLMTLFNLEHDWNFEHVPAFNQKGLEEQRAIVAGNAETAAHYARILFSAMALMNMRNIVRVPVEPKPLHRAARRRGDLPDYRYYVLAVKGRRLSATNDELSLIDDDGTRQAIHWRRGHPKTYTEAKPLLGRHVGTWWWQPHLAGRDKSRSVEKDYEIR